jgi:hypothetical protein
MYHQMSLEGGHRGRWNLTATEGHP